MVSWFSVLWFSVTLISTIWFIIGVITESLICAYDPVDTAAEFGGILMFIAFFSGQYIIGYIICYYANKKYKFKYSKNNKIGLELCALITILIISLMYVLLNASALFANAFAGNWSQCNTGYILLTIQVLNIIYSITNCVLCCIVLPKQNKRKKSSRETENESEQQDLVANDV